MRILCNVCNEWIQGLRGFRDHVRDEYDPKVATGEGSKKLVDYVEKRIDGSKAIVNG